MTVQALRWIQLSITQKLCCYLLFSWLSKLPRWIKQPSHQVFFSILGTLAATILGDSSYYGPRSRVSASITYSNRRRGSGFTFTNKYRLFWDRQMQPGHFWHSGNSATERASFLLHRALIGRSLFGINWMVPKALFPDFFFFFSKGGGGIFFCFFSFPIAPCWPFFFFWSFPPGAGGGGGAKKKNPFFFSQGGGGGAFFFFWPQRPVKKNASPELLMPETT